MSENTLLKVSSQLIRDHFEISISEDTSQEEEILQLLEEKINYLLDQDLNHLLTIFYRVDLNEQEVRSILTMTQSGEIGKALAIKVLDREKQKAATRLKYNS